MTKWFEDQDLTRQLNQVKTNMQINLKSGDQYLNGSLDYLLMSGGKMLRPAFLLIGSRFGKKAGQKDAGLIQLATAIETLHIATLVHDDIIDNAQFRRDQESIQHRYSKEYAVYMGDYLLSQCFMMLAELDLPKELAVRMSKVVSKICVGEIRQHTLRYNVDISPTQYIRIASGKTAALFAMALSAGAIVSKAKRETISQLARVGYEIGMAFQLIDDLLDYTGDQGRVGKDLRADLLRGYYSMPVIFALKAKSPQQQHFKALLTEGLGPEDLDDLMEWIHETGGIQRTRELAMKYHGRAEAMIDKLPDSSGRALLKDMLPKLIERLH